MNGICKFLKGLKTHVAMLAAMLTCLATFVGLFPSAQGHAMALGLIALATSLQRFASADVQIQLAGLTEVLKANEQLAKNNAERSPIRAGGSFVALTMFALMLFGHSTTCHAQTDLKPAILQVMDLTANTRGFFRNPDGSCVQCSIGMAGAHANDENATTLLWDTPYGPAERGGSWPSRVERYCDARGIKAWSVSGATVDDTWPWIEWAARTGRFAAVGAGQAHFQTLYGYDPTTRQWLICNNNSTHKIDRYTEAQFRELHRASGPWVVILQKPSSNAPQFVKWWR